MVEVFEVIQEDYVKKIEVQKEDLMALIKKNQSTLNRKIMEIYDKYLHKEGFIGPSRECQYKNIIDYC